jgi:hypothetical protein
MSLFLGFPEWGFTPRPFLTARVSATVQFVPRDLWVGVYVAEISDACFLCQAENADYWAWHERYGRAYPEARTRWRHEHAPLLDEIVFYLCLVPMLPVRVSISRRPPRMVAAAGAA